MVELAFAALGLAGLGLPHGASDLLLVPPRRRPSFVLAYLAVIALVALTWKIAPLPALVVLLAMSAVHFGLDRSPGQDSRTAWGLALLLVGAPAVMHGPTLMSLFTRMDGPGGRGMATGVVEGMATFGVAGLALFATAGAAKPPAWSTLAGIAACFLLPPLVGFTVGFVLLHAWPQLIERQREIGCASLAAYARRVAPVMLGAVAVLAMIALFLATLPAAPLRILFAAIAALATPHMLVTPLWRGAPRDAMAPARIAPSLALGATAAR